MEPRLLVLALLQLSATVSLDNGPKRDVADSVEWRLFDSFITNHSRSYRDDLEELNHRFQVFQVIDTLSLIHILPLLNVSPLIQQSLERQRQLNVYEAEHGGTALYGINKFSDLTPEEFKSNIVSLVREFLVECLSRVMQQSSSGQT